MAAKPGCFASLSPNQPVTMNDIEIEAISMATFKQNMQEQLDGYNLNFQVALNANMKKHRHLISPLLN